MLKMVKSAWSFTIEAPKQSEATKWAPVKGKWFASLLELAKIRAVIR